jgi:hypothetical protein
MCSAWRSAASGARKLAGPDCAFADPADGAGHIPAAPRLNPVPVESRGFSLTDWPAACFESVSNVVELEPEEPCMNRIVVMSVLGALGVVACASNPVPPAKVTDTQASISAAEAVGASNNPRAALHMKLAREQLQQGEALLRDGEEEEARLVIDRARMDAELAMALTREEKARGQAKHSQDKLSAQSGSR